ncbi:LysR family transcriptional regulator [Rhizobium giardinii]|jgi:DNA-binding transcriptional LysR family regulator|uniref:HTH-type transcriptional regulator TtuA n=1 Tax=Rhizobium giardinii TaxID=56731 RepID=A0A7W8X903_9HYPH|nr:LysR family transcriptional regulator [Rhizobium giardinii]MBB5535068.1 DNA-binding transcriptional LysR family regulator [Rhizobium giardinii]
MARLDVNRSGEMEVFVRVVDLGGFSAAARHFTMTPSAVSKLVSRLEARLNARLVNRSTRKLQLTPEGCRYYEHGVRVLANLDEAEGAAALANNPSGLVRVSCNIPFGRHILLPVLADFMALYPDVSLDLSLTDSVVDLLEDRADVAVRAGPLKSSALMARKLGTVKMHIAAAPGYIERRGAPHHPDDLQKHNLLGPSYVRTAGGWPFVAGGVYMTIRPAGNIRASDGEALRELALAGAGLARLADFQVREDFARGALTPVLEAFTATDSEEVHAVFLGQGGHIPARVRVFLDFLSARCRIG